MKQQTQKVAIKHIILELEDNTSEEASSRNLEVEETSFIEGEELFSLPCENPLENQWGAALVFGSQWNIDG